MCNLWDFAYKGDAVWSDVRSLRLLCVIEYFRRAAVCRSEGGGELLLANLYGADDDAGRWKRKARKRRETEQRKARESGDVMEIEKDEIRLWQRIDV
jgi:hypothetical protein